MNFVRFGMKGASISFSNICIKYSSDSHFIVSKTNEDLIRNKFCSNNVLFLYRSTVFKLIISVFEIVKYLRATSDPLCVLMPSPFDWLLLFKKGGSKSVLMLVHDNKTHSGDNKIGAFLAQSYWKYCRPNIICLSKFVKTSLLTSKYNVIDTLNHPYFVDDNMLATVSDLSDRKYDFGFFGRMRQYQGISVFDSFLKLFSETSLSVVICGGKYKSFEDKNARLSIFNSPISDKEFFSLMAQTKCIILPYLEGTQSGIIPNALALRCNIITTRVGGLPEQDLLSRFIYLDDFSEQSIKFAINKAVESNLMSVNDVNDSIFINSISPENFVKKLHHFHL